MKGTTNMSGVQEQGKFSLPPEGEYEVEIIEIRDGKSSNGDPMVSIKLIITEGEYRDKAWVWDNILIPSPDSAAAKILGRTKHFLHCIGEEYEGDNLEWDSDRWYKPCRIRIAHEKPNEFHKFPKATVAEYILDEDAAEVKDDGPEL
jgi:hypothetical protein